MLPILQVGPFALQLPGLILLAGLWLGINLAERYADRFGVEASELSKLIMVSLLAALLGARLVYALRYLEVFLASPLSLLSLNPGLLDPLGGLACGVLAGWIYTQRKKLPPWGTLDALTPAAAVMAIFLALAHLASGAAFGAETSLPWALELWGAKRHPSQIYEALAAVLILLICWPGRKTWRQNPAGIYFLSFVALSAGGAALFGSLPRRQSDLAVGSAHQPDHRLAGACPQPVGHCCPKKQIPPPRRCNHGRTTSA